MRLVSLAAKVLVGPLEAGARGSGHSAIGLDLASDLKGIKNVGKLQKRRISSFNPHLSRPVECFCEGWPRLRGGGRGRRGKVAHAALRQEKRDQNVTKVTPQLHGDGHTGGRGPKEGLTEFHEGANEAEDDEIHSKIFSGC